MERHSLYRAYRPSTFAEVIGQEHVTEVLAGHLQAGHEGHAYLLSGSRGLGKTTIARIFAKEVGSSERDTFEIDAASNNSVDDIRALTESVYTLPFESKYKVYILDEVHMLSKGAWNAFLKTLEEPPAHAIFILATTELAKVPETVQSRCQVYELKKPTRAHVEKLIAYVAKKEKVTLEKGVGTLISYLADGSYRDALSKFEKILRISKDNVISLSEAEKVSGAPPQKLVHDLAQALVEKKVEEALGYIRTLEEGNIDMTLFLELLLSYVRSALLHRTAPSLRKEIEEELGVDTTTSITALSASALTHTLLLSLLDARARMRNAPLASLPLELAAIEYCSQK